MNDQAHPKAPCAPYFNESLSLDDRIDSLLAALTLQEKIQCLGTNPSVPRLGIKGSGHVEGLHGLTLGGPGRWGREQPLATTTFPQAIGLAETWDPEALRRCAEVEAYEARYFFQSARFQRGGLVVRAPNADLGRDPRWGRTEECYGEDAFLTGKLATAFVRGLQGDHPKYWKTASLLKHFLANSNENERERSSSDFDERLFREYYSEPFRRAVVEGGARAYMAAYNAYRGVPCTTHPMHREITIAEWGQDGIVCTDGGAFKLLVSAHEHYPDLAEAAAACLRAGITQFLDDFKAGVEQALARQSLSEAELDEALRRTFRVILRLGLLDDPEHVPYACIGAEEMLPTDRQDHREAVREITRRSIVLLKNSNGLLPIDRKPRWGRPLHLGVFGPLADCVLLDWYSGTPPYWVSPLEGIRRKVGDGCQITSVNNNDTSELIRVARLVDVCVVCVGNHPTGDDGWAKVTRPSYGKEAVDRASLELEHEALIKQVFDVNPRTIVVLISSFPYAINWCQSNVGAIVHLTHNSQELGNALADVLFGDYNPGGRLVQTWPKALDQLPPMLDYDLRRGRTYQYSEVEPLYPFGHGLSYTRFEYAALQVSADTLDAQGSLAIKLSVSNTGKLFGDDVVQLYVRRKHSQVQRPLKELKAFRRVSLAPGETQTVTLDLPARELAHWDVDRGGFWVEPGDVELLVGRSSANILLKTSVRVTGEAPVTKV